jgi:hypothetical protein
VPSDVFVLNVIVGPVVIAQHTPRAVIDPPPSLVTLPPLDAVVCVIKDATVVVRVGITIATVVLNVISDP